MAARIFKSLTSLFSDVGEKKRRAAAARTAGARGTQPKPREVFDAACNQMAAAFAPEGFAYARSARKLTKRVGDLTFQIWFSSSHNNVAGEHVALGIAANVRSPVLKKWRARQEHSIRTDDWIAGGMVHLLATDAVYMAWELAQDTQLAIQDAEAFLRSGILPYFDQFLPLERLIGHLEDSWPPELEVGSAVELALCFATHADAQAILLRYVADHATVASDVPAAIAKLDASGFPAYRVTRYAEQVAWLCKAHGLRWQ